MNGESRGLKTNFTCTDEWLGDTKTVIDKMPTNGKGFEHGVLYCFNRNLEGELCNQCKSREECKKELRILKNAAEEISKLAKNFQYTFPMNTIENSKDKECVAIEIYLGKSRKGI